MDLKHPANRVAVSSKIFRDFGIDVGSKWTNITVSHINNKKRIHKLMGCVPGIFKLLAMRAVSQSTLGSKLPSQHIKLGECDSRAVMTLMRISYSVP